MSFSLPGLDPIDLAYQIGRRQGMDDGLDVLRRAREWMRSARRRADLPQWVELEIAALESKRPDVQLGPYEAGVGPSVQKSDGTNYDIRLRWVSQEWWDKVTKKDPE